MLGGNASRRGHNPRLDLDDPEIAARTLHTQIRKKPLLEAFYADVYRRFQAVVERAAVPARAGITPSATPSSSADTTSGGRDASGANAGSGAHAMSRAVGDVVELGSGGGFLKAFIPEAITTDVFPFEGVDRVVDARRLPFEDQSLRAVLLLNVFHHIPDVAAFLSELSRCLTFEGRALIVDQYPGWLSRPIYRYLHHEPFDAKARAWTFAPTGPLSGANGALAWMVFIRDRPRFEREFPGLRIESIIRHTPLVYWLSGGLKRWCLVPRALSGAAQVLDRTLLRLSADAASFIDIELVRSSPRPKPHGELDRTAYSTNADSANGEIEGRPRPKVPRA
ncbi:MAG: class I SAM-dependent methyltransferase [Deltaproteobacteria bacterium]|nr:class I SAM-dependent methyltransferase [Deltaproteobacteria bacterium]